MLENENMTLRESIKHEQEIRLEQAKDIMELETRLKSAEEEVIKSQEERYQLALDINSLGNLALFRWTFRLQPNGTHI